jgi:flagellar FliL protein
MAEPAVESEESPKKKSKLPLIIGLVLMLLLGGGAFFAVYSGLILGPSTPEGEAAPAAEGETAEAAPATAFVPLDPMVISIDDGRAKHLRFSAQLEVPTAHQAEVEHLKPRVMDVLNGFLRAVEVKDLEDPSALIRLRAQMLRRIQVVAGDGMVNDILVIEFVMN